MQEIALHILDVTENAIAAGASRIVVDVRSDRADDVLSVEIRDNGEGMDSETLGRAADPFFTRKPGKKIGLGLALLAQAAREAGGEFALESAPGRGTRVRATFALGHPDCKPLGDVVETVELMRMTHPEIEFTVNCDLEKSNPRGGSS